MKKIGPILLLITICCSSSWAEPDESVRTLVRANDAFAFRIYADLATNHGNLVFSPLSVSMALAMASAGANGTTLTEIRTVLATAQPENELHQAFNNLRRQIGASLKKSPVTLDIDNSLWLQRNYDIKKTFPDALMKYYGSQLQQADFTGNPDAAANEINAWIEQATHGRVKNMLGPEIVSSETVFMLVSTIYFKGRWRSRFGRSNTHQEPFFVTPEERVMVPTMSQENTFRLAELDSVAVLVLPYVGSKFSMVLFIPKESNGLQALEKGMTPDRVNGWLRALSPAELQLYLPRFFFECTFPLKETLSRLGMPSAFLKGQADFTGVNPDNLLYLATVLQRAGVEVDEEGTTAWAATAAAGAEFGLAPSPRVFRIDHPFVFMITETGTGSILFLGRVTDPSRK